MRRVTNAALIFNTGAIKMKEEKKNPLLLFGLIFPGIFLFMGVIFLVLGISFGVYQSNLKEDCTESAQAVVLRLKENNDDGTSVYSPVVQFTDISGEAVTAQNNTYSSSYATLNEGDKLNIKYDPDSPSSRWYIDDGSDIFDTVTKVFFIIGLLFTVMSVSAIVIVLVIFFKQRKKLQQSLTTTIP